MTKIIKSILLILFVSTFLFAPITKAKSLDDQLCNATKDAWGGALAVGCSGQTTFTDFGKYSTFSPPPADMYPDIIVQEPNLKELIKKIANYALGFLALIATIAIIYAGFLYVTARGEQEQLDQGKKGVTNAVIGIIIILISYALVNTVLQSPSGDSSSGGTADGGSGGGGPDSGTKAPDGKYFASVIQTAANSFYSNYKSYIEIKEDIENIKKLSANAESLISVEDARLTADEEKAQEKKNQIDVLKTIAQELQKIEKYVPEISQTYIKAKEAEYFIRNAMVGTISLNNFFNVKNAYAEDANTPPYIDDCAPNPDWDDIFSASKQLPCYLTNVLVANREDFNYLNRKLQTEIKKEIGIKISDQTSKNITDLILLLIGTDPDDDLNYDEITYMTEKSSSKPGLLDQIYVGNKTDYTNLTATDAYTPAEIDTVIETVDTFGALGESIQDLQFFWAVITADPIKGKAPLIVKLDGLKSRDPRGNTIADNQYLWTINDVDAGTKTAKTIQKNGAVITYPFETEGTFKVQLLINDAACVEKKDDIYVSKSCDVKIAPGIAFTTIVVQPPSSQLYLTANTSDNVKVLLASYNQDCQTINQCESQQKCNDPNKTIEQTADCVKSCEQITAGCNQLYFNKGTVNFTTYQGEQGITFDGCSSGDADGHDPALVSWDFGDRTKEDNQAFPAFCNPKHLYNKEGKYPLTFKITDVQGNNDQVKIIVNITTLAAFATVDPATGGSLETVYTLDGSNSQTTEGEISGYSWKVEQEDENTNKWSDVTSTVLLLSGSDKATVTPRFTETATYQATLTVTNSVGKTATDVIVFTVESKPPVALYTYSVPDSAKPDQYLFDAGNSYDPDPKSTLNYTWTIPEKPDPVVATTPKSSKSNTLITFSQIGDYKVTLEVNDGTKSTYITQTITVPKVLNVDLKLEKNMFVVDNEGKVKDVKFNASSNLGQIFDIEYSDGLKDTAKVDAKTGAVYATAFTHTFDKPKAGTHLITLTVYNAEGEQNSISKTIFIGDGTTPIAVSILKLNGTAIDNHGTVNKPIIIYRNTKLVFDASSSFNKDGTPKNLSYAWKINNKEFKTESQLVTTDEGLTISDKIVSGNLPGQPADIKVQLTVFDEGSNPKKASTNDQTIYFKLQKTPPALQSIEAIPSGTVTPVSVQVKAIGATDPDGKIVKYIWWYKKPGDNDNSIYGNKVITNITKNAETKLVIPTEDNSTNFPAPIYQIGVDLVDDENTTFELDKSTTVKPASVNVTYGDNQGPEIIMVKADRTFIKKGEEVQFISEATDPEKDPLAFSWNFDGGSGTSGLQNTKAIFRNKGEYQVILTVSDDANNYIHSEPIEITVDSDGTMPVAKFEIKTLDKDKKKVTFDISRSEIFVATGPSVARYVFDCDIQDENDRDENQTDKTAIECSYDSNKKYKAKLIVIDTEGNQGEFIADVDLSLEKPAPEGPYPVADFTFKQDDKSKKVQFDATRSKPGDSAKIEDYDVKWDFNFGKTAIPGSGLTTAYEYSSNGLYSVQLSICLKTKDCTNPRYSSTKVKSVNVVEPSSKPPYATFQHKFVEELSDGKIKISFDARNSKAYDEAVIDKYDWYFDFDKNPTVKKTSEDSPLITNIYDAYGSYNVKLVLTDSQSNQTEIFVPINYEKPDSKKPTADFTFSIDQTNRLKVSFNASRSKPAVDDSISSYSWDFGDGASATGLTTDHLYPKYAVYQVKLTVMAKGGKNDDQIKSVKLEEQKVKPPQANFTYKQLEGSTELRFDASNSVAGDKPIATYAWDFDLENAGTLKGDKMIQNQSLKPGTYTVKLVAGDGTITDSDIKTINVKSVKYPAPKPSFTYTVTSADQNGIIVRFNASNSIIPEGLTPEYLWDFDLNEDGSDPDSNTINDEETDTPESERSKAVQLRTYKTYGTYSVKLVVRLKEPAEGSAEISKDITLTPPDAKPPVPNFTYFVNGGTIIFDAGSSQSFPPAAGIKYYDWDFNIEENATDSDWIPDNDHTADHPGIEIKENGKIVKFTYPASGTYKVKLTVSDDYRPEFTISKVNVIRIPEFEKPSPELVAKLATNLDSPEYTDGNIHIKGDEGYVTFIFDESEGNIINYVLDKNIAFDSDMDKEVNNDIDLDLADSTDQKTWQEVYFKKAWGKNGKITAELTVTDMDDKIDTVPRTIVFDPPPATKLPKPAFLYEVIEPKNGAVKVKFTNISKPGDSSNQAALDGIKTWWDFNTVKEESGDNNPANDEQEMGKDSAIYTYSDYGNYKIKLTVFNKDGGSENILKTIKLLDPEEGAYEDIEAKLWSNPAPSPQDPKNRVHLTGAKGDVTFDFTGSVGSTLNKFIIDKNIYFDSDGNGIKDDDINYETATRGTWKTDFDKSWGKIIVRLIVKNQFGQTDDVTREIVFDTAEDPVAANLSTFKDKPIPAIFIALFALLVPFAILKLSQYSSNKKKFKIKKL